MAYDIDPNIIKEYFKKLANDDLYGLKDIQNIIKDMNLYQKITLYSMSHGKLLQSSFTIYKIQHSLDLLKKFETNINKIAKVYYIMPLKSKTLIQ